MKWECESHNQRDGRISQRVEISEPVKWLQAHPIVGDAQLLRLYANLDDVDRARERKLAELDSVTSVARGNLQSVRTQQANLQSQAAEHERAGRQVPEFTG